MKHHLPFADIIETLEGFGRKFESLKDAQDSLAADKDSMAAYALVELLRRLGAVGRALRGRSLPDVLDYALHFENAKAFPEKQVGDRLFVCDFEDERVDQWVIVGKGEHDECEVVPLSDTTVVDGERFSVSRIASSDFYGTIAEAVKAAAEADMQYHGPYYARAQKAMELTKSAVDAGELMKAMNGLFEE